MEDTMRAQVKRTLKENQLFYYCVIYYTALHGPWQGVCFSLCDRRVGPQRYLKQFVVLKYEPRKDNDVDDKDHSCS